MEKIDSVSLKQCFLFLLDMRNRQKKRYMMWIYTILLALVAEEGADVSWLREKNKTIKKVFLLLSYIYTFHISVSVYIPNQTNTRSFLVSYFLFFVCFSIFVMVIFFSLLYVFVCVR